MIRPVAQLNKYIYSVSDLVFSAPSFTEAITIPSAYVKSITVSKMYEKNIVPLMYVSMHVYKDVYQQIATSIDNLTASFTLYKSIDTTEVELNDSTVGTYRIPIIQGTFKAFNRDLLDVRVPGQISNTKDGATNMTQQTLELNLYMFDHEQVLKYKKNSSQILVSTSNDCLFAMLKDRGYKNVLMSSTNSYETKNFIIPYGTLGENLDFMNTYYGIYDTPRILFSDFDATYLLDKGATGTTLRQDELSTVAMYMEKTEESISAANGCYIDKDNGHYIMNVTPFTINDSGTMLDFGTAGKLTSMISGTSQKFQDVIGDYDAEKATVVNNEKIHKQAMYMINEEKRGMNIEFSDIDTSIITPNKLYTLIPDSFYDSSYDIKGNYRLTHSIMVFNRQAENRMKSVTQCGFLKIG